MSIDVNLAGRGRLKRATLEATIIRADGTVEHLGIIADTRWSFRLRQFCKRILRRKEPR